MNIDIPEFFSIIFFGNTLSAYFLSLLKFVIIFLALYVVKKYLIGNLRVLAQKTENGVDNILVSGLNEIQVGLVLLISLYFSISDLSGFEIFKKFIYIPMVLMIAYNFIKIGVNYITYGSDHFINKRQDDKENSEIIKLLSFIAKVGLWTIVSLTVISNFGYNVNSLLAGLGIGGIAVALAVQNMLSDVFSSFSIHLDKPFKVGDYIVVGNNSGTVKKIGIKTTRLQTFQGEELVISNKELTESRVQNFGLMNQRRIAFVVKITYGNERIKIEKALEIIKNSIKENEIVKFDRVFLRNLGDFALEIECVYLMMTGNMTKYLEVQQEINLDILEGFKKESIEFALPSALFVNQ